MIFVSGFDLTGRMTREASRENERRLAEWKRDCEIHYLRFRIESIENQIRNPAQ